MKRLISYSDSLFDVVSLANVKLHLNAVRTDQDALLTMYLEAAIARCSNYLGFEIRRAVVDYYYTQSEVFNFTPTVGHSSTYLRIPANILAVSSFKYRDDTDADVNMDAADYSFINIGEHIPEIVILSSPSTFSETGYAYRVRVTEGYYISRVGDHSTADQHDMLPPAIITAILLNLTHLYENRNDVNVINTYQLVVGSEHFLFPYSKLQIL